MDLPDWLCESKVPSPVGLICGKEKHVNDSTTVTIVEAAVIVEAVYPASSPYCSVPLSSLLLLPPFVGVVPVVGVVVAGSDVVHIVSVIVVVINPCQSICEDSQCVRRAVSQNSQRSTHEGIQQGDTPGSHSAVCRKKHDERNA